MSLLAASHWTLDEALPLIRGLQPHTRKFGYHLTLGGGVLNHGESKKDLDLFFLPLNPTGGKVPEGWASEANADKLLEWLDALWGDRKPLLDASYGAGEGSFARRLGDPYTGGWQNPPERIRAAVLSDGRISARFAVGNDPITGQALVFDTVRNAWFVDRGEQTQDRPEQQKDATYKKTGKYEFDGLRIDVFVL